MLNFLTKKTKVQSHNIKEVPIETFEVVGISQINPYFTGEFDNEIFLTVVSFLNGSKNYDEKEGMVVAKYFTTRRCPRCKQTELIPVKMRINMDSLYLKNEEEVAFDAYAQYPSRTNTPTVVSAYCNSCSSCFQMRVKNKDLWIKEAKKIKERDLIGSFWEEYHVK